MMIVISPDLNAVKISFKHFVPEKVTICYINYVADGTRLATGAAWCSDEDNFSRSVGRKVSLARALKRAGYAKTMRESIWHKYFEKVGKVA